MTTPSTCMMMLAVMYGMMPSAKIEKLLNAPPENRFKKPSAPPPWATSRSCWTAYWSTPGTWMWTPTRYRPIIAIVNSTLLRRSGTLNTFFTFASTDNSSTKTTGRSAARRHRIVDLAVGELVALGGGADLVGQRNERDATARGRDGRLGRLRNGVRGDVDLAGQRAKPEDLDEVALAQQAALDEDVGGDLADAELGDRVQVDGGVLDAERVVEALQFRDTLLERHLAAFEAAGYLAATARVLALGTGSRGLAALTADATTDALGCFGGARRRREFVDAHQLVVLSSTVMRCGTRAIMP